MFALGNACASRFRSAASV